MRGQNAQTQAGHGATTTTGHAGSPAGAFALPQRLHAKAEAALIGADEAHLEAVAQCLRFKIEQVTQRLDEARRSHGRMGQEALDRDLSIYRMSAQLRLLRRFGMDLCLGRMDGVDDTGRPVRNYIGRIGLTDADGQHLLLDWRAPAAEPFFAATYANPLGLISRRRYRWINGHIRDYWDEVFDPGALTGPVALDEDSAFITSLGSSRSTQMRDVLSTIQADQDAIIRAGSRGALVVDGGPGTGKTVVALHRAAYLLYADPRLGEGRGGVLFVGPHHPYLAYVADVLPGLGEEGVRTCTLGDLVCEGQDAQDESDPRVARLKANAQMVAAIEPAVALYEEIPEGMLVETPWADIPLEENDWAEAFASVEPGTPHNEAREQIWEELLTILVDKADIVEAAEDEQEGSPELLRAALAQHTRLRGALERAWPMIDATDLVADLWSVPAYLRRCAPWLSREEIRLLQRPDTAAWTVSDLPLLDAARHRLGDAGSSGRQRRRAAALARQRDYMSEVVDRLIEADDSELGEVRMLRVSDAQNTLVDESIVEAVDEDALAGPFAHIVVDEAQELTAAEWSMLLRRCPSRSFTVVGDRSQARHGFAESWRERLEGAGLVDVHLTPLTVNYRTPQEVMTHAEPVIREAIPDANVPTSIRSSGYPVRYLEGADRTDLERVLDEWLADHDEGVACVIGDPTYPDRIRVRSLRPQDCKGLEFDVVVLVNPQAFGDDIEGAVDRYVAMTRTTQQLIVLTTD